MSKSVAIFLAISIFLLIFYTFKYVRNSESEKISEQLQEALENQDNLLIKIAFCLQPIKLNKYLMRQA